MLFGFLDALGAVKSLPNKGISKKSAMHKGSSVLSVWEVLSPKVDASWDQADGKAELPCLFSDVVSLVL